jgi:hypothetical protein
MTRLPCSPGSTLVLRLNQETVHDFILLFMQPCGPHLTLLATGSLEWSLLVFSTPGGLTGDDLSRLFFTCTNTSQATTFTCNTKPRINPHNVANHSSHQEVTIHRSSNHTWSSLFYDEFSVIHDESGTSYTTTFFVVVPCPCWKKRICWALLNTCVLRFAQLLKCRLVFYCWLICVSNGFQVLICILFDRLLRLLFTARGRVSRGKWSFFLSLRNNLKILVICVVGTPADWMSSLITVTTFMFHFLLVIVCICFWPSLVLW